MRPATLNSFIYVSNNPVRLTDMLGLCATDPYDPYYDYDCWILAIMVAELTGEPLEDVGKASYYWLLQAYEGLRNEPSIHDPLTSRQWMLANKNARLFEIPVELVAGTIATEIVDDTQWHDPLFDAFLEMGLSGHAHEADAEWDISYSEKPFLLWTEFLGGYEHYWGLLGGRGPGPGVANVHVGTAKAAEDYFAAYYPEKRLLEPPPDIYTRLDWLLRDESNIRYTAAILKQLADLRKGSCGEPKIGPHFQDLSLVDMQIIYGAFRAGWESYDGTKVGYQQWEAPGTYGKQIHQWLLFYQTKLRAECGN
jgi:hypothetical protein